MENKKIMYVVVNMFEFKYSDKREYYGAPYLTLEDAQKYIIDTDWRYSNIGLVMFSYEVQPAGYVTIVKQVQLKRCNLKALKMTTAQIEKAKKTAEETLRNALVVIS